jgi:hypothetical protein
MSSFATIALNDSVPTSHDFEPVHISDNVAKWADREGGIAVGYPIITAHVRPPTKASRAHKVTLKVSVPTLEEASSGGSFVPPPTKAFDCLAVIEMVLPERSTLLERQDFFAYVKNLLANANVTSMVEDTEPVY